MHPNNVDAPQQDRCNQEVWKVMESTAFLTLPSLTHSILWVNAIINPRKWQRWCFYPLSVKPIPSLGFCGLGSARNSPVRPAGFMLCLPFWCKCGWTTLVPWGSCPWRQTNSLQFFCPSRYPSIATTIYQLLKKSLSSPEVQFFRQIRGFITALFVRTGACDMPILSASLRRHYSPFHLDLLRLYELPTTMSCLLALW